MQQDSEQLSTEVSIDASPSLDRMFTTADYSDILEQFGLHYEKLGPYYKVMEVDRNMGWIIDISVIVCQTRPLLNKVIPFLVQEKVPFKIARNSEKAEFILNGKLGNQLLGKIVVVYPSTNDSALALALELIHLTSAFRGPEILTDRHLGSVVYTRYGALNPVTEINQGGVEVKVVYDSQGQIYKDPISIPFYLPEGIHWPFSKITSPKVPSKQTILQNRYKPMYILKEDTKGSVRKGLYLEKWWRIKWCVIKEAKFNMDADTEGRDMVDRLKWQYELNKTLKNSIPMPKTYDFFEENKDTYMVMEFIKGVDLDQIITKKFLDKKRGEILTSDWEELFGYARAILDIIERMHVLGFLHRDITPTNFLITKKQAIYLIDLEISYSLRSNQPNPPFRLGTIGFMSPEQDALEKPAVDQDIFAIGGTLIAILTGLLPGLLAVEFKETLKEQLCFLLQDNEFADVLGDCIDRNPDNRPDIPCIRTGLDRFIQRQKSLTTQTLADPGQPLDRKELQEFLDKAISGLVTPMMLDTNYRWVSKTSIVDGADHQLRSYSIYSNFYQGVGGVLFLLARAQKLGFSIKPCFQASRNSMAFIQNDQSWRSKSAPGGLYFGSAGIALVLAECIDSGLVRNEAEIIHQLKLCFENDNLTGSGMVKGLAGKGMALLRMISLIDDPLIHALLQRTLGQILSSQHQEGYWETVSDTSNKKLVATGFGHGTSGILCFLLSYLKTYNDNQSARDATFRGLEWLKKQLRKAHGVIKWPLNDRNNLSSMDFQDGCSGIVLAFTKSYELFGEKSHRQLAENCLRTYLRCGISRNLCLGQGLVGIAETYLEAARIFNASEWKRQAEWVGQFLLHNYRVYDNNSIYWQAEGGPITTPGLLEGTSGIIHFLLRVYQPDHLSHPLLVW